MCVRGCVYTRARVCVYVCVLRYVCACVCACMRDSVCASVFPARVRARVCMCALACMTASKKLDSKLTTGEKSFSIAYFGGVCLSTCTRTRDSASFGQD